MADDKLLENKIDNIDKHLTNHIKQTNRRFELVEADVKDIRQTNTDMVKEVTRAVTGLEAIASQVTHFYDEFLRDRDEQQASIKQNDTFRIKWMTAIGIVLAITTVAEIFINLDKIKALLGV